MRFARQLSLAALFAIFATVPHPCTSGEDKQGELDARVSAFLESHRSSWHDLNIQVSDGQRLYDLVAQNGYTRTLEIGTSTGHSALWIAWALSKTGGKLITIEIDETRYRQALANFKEAGLSDYIDARLADAHGLVRSLEGPFDFVFLDADKEWYARYFVMLRSKLAPGGCFVAHNVSKPPRAGWVVAFLAAVDAAPGFKTEIVGSQRAPMSISYYRPPQQ